ncbi:hypothetical protein RT41_GL001539 [Lactococcus fujiensis JCM 16395]|uniref:Uncharacterized protein n=1 Tax=Lactococcus fujiensis JCM 16395 TaxID=1291764 RepID=A0A2A5RLU3_9LACT|nr:hypothetical protein RT41_GL001539 [Lactococcus fujiensis JCM 16395]
MTFPDNKGKIFLDRKVLFKRIDIENLWLMETDLFKKGMGYSYKFDDLNK